MYNTILGIIFLILFLFGLSWKLSIIIHKWLLDYSYDTSCVTEADVLLFMRGEKLFSEKIGERKQYAKEVLNSFISKYSCWTKTDKSHYYNKDCCIFFGYGKILIRDSYETDEEFPFDCDIQIENDNEEFKDLIKTARQKHKDYKKQTLS